mmetsp:Transcript_19718/g.36681  ORF Transcript_19718/g.36681 Transcript_19718/m.36681 type:complete len:471 (-) Transcript_19718:925-2337(-)
MYSEMGLEVSADFSASELKHLARPSPAKSLQSIIKSAKSLTSLPEKSLITCITFQSVQEAKSNTDLSKAGFAAHVERLSWSMSSYMVEHSPKSMGSSSSSPPPSPQAALYLSYFSSNSESATGLPSSSSSPSSLRQVSGTGTDRQDKLQSTAVTPSSARPLLSMQVSTPSTTRSQVWPSSEQSSAKTHDIALYWVKSCPAASQDGRLGPKSALQPQYFFGFRSRSVMYGPSGLLLSVAMDEMAERQSPSSAPESAPAQADTISAKISALLRTAVASSIGFHSVQEENCWTVASAPGSCTQSQTGTSSSLVVQWSKSMSIGRGIPPPPSPSSSSKTLDSPLVVSTVVGEVGAASESSTTEAVENSLSAPSSLATLLMVWASSPSSTASFNASNSSSTSASASTLPQSPEDEHGTTSVTVNSTSTSSGAGNKERLSTGSLSTGVPPNFLMVTRVFSAASPRLLLILLANTSM